MLKEPADLVGREISAVAFVRDVVEFHFDGPTLRSRTDPRVAVGEAVYRFPKPGSRDALCLVIGSTVHSLSFDEARISNSRPATAAGSASRWRRAKPCGWPKLGLLEGL